jgi:cell division protein FtsI (penicillin-binding protein 3)
VISFGQELSVSAIQLAGAYSAVANGGQLFEAKIIRGIRDPNGRLEEYPSRLIRRVVSQKTAAKVKDILVGVVDRGTGRSAGLSQWKVAGKTGTAQKADPVKGGYQKNKYIVSFCGFVPADNPRLTIVIVYDEPEGMAQGSIQAAPIFRDLAQRALGYLSIPSDDATHPAS